MNPPAEKPANTSARVVLEVSGLDLAFATEASELEVVSELGFAVAAGATLALVGESGCGKSITALAVMGLLDFPGRIKAGSIRLQQRELVGLNSADYRELRGNRIGMVFQEPMSSLNPVFRVGDQVAEVLQRHRAMSEREARAEALRLFELVRIPSPRQRIDQYPHELSGGMKQRVMIAIALACQPDLLIADEPTTALDVTVQAQIMKLLADLQQQLGMAMLLISHNLGLVARYADEVAVMYAGRIVERAPVRELFARPAHPYTQALLASLPRPGHQGEPLAAIEGAVPAPAQFPAGCRFSGRCPSVMPHCAERQPPSREIGPGHSADCWLLVEAEDR